MIPADKSVRPYSLLPLATNPHAIATADLLSFSRGQGRSTPVRVPGTPFPSSTLPTEFGAPLTTNQDGDEFLAHGPKTRLMGRVFIVGDVHRNAGILNIDTCHGEPANRAFPIDCRTTLRIEMFAGTIAAPPCFREERPPVVSLLTFHVPRARSLWLGPAVCDDFQIRRHHQGFGIREATWKACRHLARPVRRVSRRKAI